MDYRLIFSRHNHLFRRIFKGGNGNHFTFELMKFPVRISKPVLIVLHISFWGLLFSLPFLLASYAENNPSPKASHHPGGFFYALKCIFWIAFFYINALFLIPKLFYRRYYGKYVLSLFLMMAANLSLFELPYFLLTKTLQFFSFRTFVIFNTFPFLFILACSTAYKMFVDRLQSDKDASEKETEHLKTELSFLRSQISPHFMFNVLNGMVALARKKSDLLEPSLIKLSSILRYMLYENDEEKVSLEKELEYLQSYIDLQKQRFGKSICVNTCIQAIDDNYYIEPMLLIPFVENAFKHGTGILPDSQIDISLTATNGLLDFSVKNKYDEASQEIKDKTNGIGLNNVYRRLNLLYKNRHSLIVKPGQGYFTVSLQLNLS